MTNLSGTITVGGTAQILSPARPDRQGLIIENLSNGDLWVNFLGTNATIGGTSGSIKLESGTYYEAPFYNRSNQIFAGNDPSVSIIGATTGQTFTALEW